MIAIKKQFLYNNKNILILILLCLIVYSKSLLYDFSPMDEQWLILKNTKFYDKWENINAMFSKPTSGFYYRPLLLFSFMVDYHLGNISPFVYHFTNLFLHIICVTLLYQFLLFTCIDNKLALLAASLFSIHPLMLHAVVWIPGRNVIMLCIWMLLSFNFLIKYFLNDSIKYFSLHIFCFLCALLTKETAVVFPFIFMAIFYIHSKKKIIKPLSITWLIIICLWFIVRSFIINGSPAQSNDFISNVKDAISALFIYIGKTLLPIQLSVFPTLNNSSVFFGILSIIIVGLLCFKLGIKDKKNAVLGILIFIIILILPIWFSAISNTGEHYEHRAYSSMVGFILFLTCIDFKINSKYFNYVSVFVITVFGLITFIRMPIYKNQLSFLDSGIEDNPNYYLFYTQKATYLHAQKNYVSAIEYYNKGILLRPNLVDAIYNRGTAYASIGKNENAIIDFTNAISKSKFNPDMYLNRCIAYYETDNIPMAMKDLLVLKERCNNLIPKELNENITKKWLKIQIAKLDIQILKNQNNAELYYYRSKLLIDAGLKEKALIDIKKACELDPFNLKYKMLK